MLKRKLLTLNKKKSFHKKIHEFFVFLSIKILWFNVKKNILHTFLSQPYICDNFRYLHFRFQQLSATIHIQIWYSITNIFFIYLFILIFPKYLSNILLFYFPTKLKKKIIITKIQSSPLIRKCLGKHRIFLLQESFN